MLINIFANSCAALPIPSAICRAEVLNSTVFWRLKVHEEKKQSVWREVFFFSSFWFDDGKALNQSHLIWVLPKWCPKREGRTDNTSIESVAFFAASFALRVKAAVDWCTMAWKAFVALSTLCWTLVLPEKRPIKVARIWCSRQAGGPEGGAAKKGVEKKTQVKKQPNNYRVKGFYSRAIQRKRQNDMIKTKWWVACVGDTT